MSLQERLDCRLQNPMFCQVLCLGRHTLTGVICTAGTQQQDWTADCRLYSKRRVDADALFGVVRAEVELLLPAGAPLVVAMDDSIHRKSGKKTPGVAWRVDPTGPKFQVNFVLAQRVLQLAAAVPFGKEGAARSIPIDFVQAPTPKRPNKKTGTEQEWEKYRERQRQMNINAVAWRRLRYLAEQTERELWVTVDGRFTNRTVLKNLPALAKLIGRIRKDAKLYGVAPEKKATAKGGRPRRYGPPLPTPEEMRKDESIPWQKVKAYAAGKVHEFRIKTVEPVKWRPAGVGQVLRLIIIAPLEYRLSKKGKVLYRDPAFLICTDGQLPLEKVLQAFLWRWGIEVNFRDEKSVLGVGQAQVRNPNSVSLTPAVAVVAYSLLMLAGIQTYGADGLPQGVPVPAWLRKRTPKQASLARLINQVRFEMWGESLCPEGFSGFSNPRVIDAEAAWNQKPQKPSTTVASAVLYAKNA
jgi:hypothetical protein